MSGQPYYASLEVRRPDSVRSIRDSLWGHLEPPSGYKKVEPHITLHPGFTCDHNTAAGIAGSMAYAVNLELDVTGVSYYPSVEEPMVVKLDLEGDIEPHREVIERHVRECGGTIDREPVPPHLTLFKSGDAGEDPDSMMDPDENDGLRLYEGAYDDWSVQVGGFTLQRRG